MKIPLQATTGRAASSTDPLSWCDFATVERSTVGAGRGFVLNGDGLACVDLDHCLTADGTAAAWVTQWLDALPPTWIERSPSKQGLHIWGYATTEPPATRSLLNEHCVEVYVARRYLTVTGDRFENAPLTLANLDEPISNLFGSAEHAAYRAPT